jgi:predicted enzyme related to lactoylglutathione lyase
MIANAVRVVLLCLLPVSILDTAVGREEPGREQERAVVIQYLEIVTPDVDATCDALEAMRGVSFGEPIPEFGNARTAPLENGGRIGVRAPMRETEGPVVRPYLLVEDIEAAVDAARASGAEIAMAPAEIPGQGRFAIYILGGIQHGLWQL